MTRNTVAIVSAALFVVLAALLAVAPVPYVTWSPGKSQNVLDTSGEVQTVDVQGIATYEVSGGLLLSTLSTTSSAAQVSLPEALFAHWVPGSQVVPREWVYQPGITQEQLMDEEDALAATTQRNARVAALRAADHPVTELPMVATVAATGPSAGKLFVGDLITRVDSQPVSTSAEVTERIQLHEVGGAAVVFEVIRDNEAVSVSVTPVGSNTGSSRVPVVGISTTVGYQIAPTISFTLDQEMEGESSGLALAIAVYDQITPNDLLAGQTIGAAGTIDPAGNVGHVDGVQQLVRGAAANGATAFLVPATNCPDLAGLTTDLTIIKVDTVDGAIDAIQLLGDPEAATEVPTC